MLIQQETWITPLDEARTLHLYIPDGLTPGQKVPVLYMFCLLYTSDAADD